MLPTDHSHAAWDEPIPLYDGESSGASIIHPNSGPGNQTAVRPRRSAARRSCNNAYVCFSPQLTSGRVDHAACPVINISLNGIALEFDQELARGTSGHVAYRTIGHRPVHLACRVRRCRKIEEGRYELGLQLSRPLSAEELKPAPIRTGRELAPGVRPRKLASTHAPPAVPPMVLPPDPPLDEAAPGDDDSDGQELTFADL